MLVFQRERLHAVLNRLEKSGDFHAMIGEKFCLPSSAGLGVIQVNVDKASSNASFMPRALGVVLSTSKSRRGGCSNSGDLLDQKTTITQYTS